jgi:hypothetical protein
MSREGREEEISVIGEPLVSREPLPGHLALTHNLVGIHIPHFGGTELTINIFRNLIRKKAVIWSEGFSIRPVYSRLKLIAKGHLVHGHGALSFIALHTIHRETTRRSVFHTFSEKCEMTGRVHKKFAGFDLHPVDDYTIILPGWDLL